jgi:GLPGLI family protein
MFKNFKIIFAIAIISLCFSASSSDNYFESENFQAQAFYFSKERMDLGDWGSKLTEVQKKQVGERLRNRLEKTYILSFNKEASNFYEEEKIDALSGATDSWGKNFTPGEQYKNVKQKINIQQQELYGKRFLVKDSLLNIEWQLSGETKQIGNYTCFRANALIPNKALYWFNFEWDDLKETTNEQIELTQVEAWYSLQIPVPHGPLEYSGLPGLILEVSAKNTTILCSKIVLNPKETIEINIPNKGEEVSKNEYMAIVKKKMKEFRENRMGRR